MNIKDASLCMLRAIKLVLCCRPFIRLFWVGCVILGKKIYISLRDERYG